MCVSNLGQVCTSKQDCGETRGPADVRSGGSLTPSPLFCFTGHESKTIIQKTPKKCQWGSSVLISLEESSEEKEFQSLPLCFHLLWQPGCETAQYLENINQNTHKHTYHKSEQISVKIKSYLI